MHKFGESFPGIKTYSVRRQSCTHCNSYYNTSFTGVQVFSVKKHSLIFYAHRGRERQKQPFRNGKGCGMNGLRSDQTATLVESCLDDIGAAAEEMIAVTDGTEQDRLGECLAGEFLRCFADQFQMLRRKAETVEVHVFCGVQAVQRLEHHAEFFYRLCGNLL